MDIWKLFKYIDLKEFIFMSLNDIYPRKDDKTTIYLAMSQQTVDK